MTKYRIYELSARTVMSYAVTDGERYTFHLSRTATEKCRIRSASHEQDSNALFFQIMCELYGDEYREHSDGQIISDLSDIISTWTLNTYSTGAARERPSSSDSKRQRPCSARRESAWTLVQGNTATSPLSVPTA